MMMIYVKCVETSRKQVIESKTVRPCGAKGDGAGGPFYGHFIYLPDHPVYLEFDNRSRLSTPINVFVGRSNRSGRGSRVG